MVALNGAAYQMVSIMDPSWMLSIWEVLIKVCCTKHVVILLWIRDGQALISVLRVIFRVVSF